MLTAIFMRLVVVFLPAFGFGALLWHLHWFLALLAFTIWSAVGWSATKARPERGESK